MAKTSQTTSEALTQKLWEKVLFDDTMKESYFSRFMSKDKGAIVQVKDQLESNKGDNVTFGLVPRTSAPIRTSGQSLEGHEDALTKYSFSVSLEEYAFGLRDRGPLDRQRAIFDMDAVSRSSIVTQGAEYVDQKCFDQLQLSPTKTIFGGTATAYSNLTASDKITPEVISRIRAGARTGYDRAQTPLKPISINGKKYFVLLVHPDQMYDLKQDPVFEQARREALERSATNPIFTGAEAIWDGVVIHEHENITIANDGGAGTVPTAKSLFLGEQALVWAWGAKPKIVTAEFDYGREHGISWQAMFAVGKPVFNSKDYGVISLQTARTKLSDA